MNINKLQYPMFTITLNEAVILQEAKRKLSFEERFLCYVTSNTAKELGFSCSVKYKLNRKIQESTQGKPTLYQYLRMVDNVSDVCDDHKIRIVWVKKLLAHNGY